MISRLAGWLREHCPALYLLARELRYPGGREPLDPETERVLRKLTGDDIRVLRGPFAGMRYLSASGSGLLPKVAGTYEYELQATVCRTLLGNYKVVINVGSGEGYYAVGYARALPAACVCAFDVDPLARRRLKSLAALNGVEDRVRIQGRCHVAELRRLLAGADPALVVCDCEGAERELLDPAVVPGLLRSDILVELHDFIDPSISPSMHARFGGTHDISRIPASGREGIDLPGLELLNAEERRLALWEGRPEGMAWAWMQARRA